MADRPGPLDRERRRRLLYGRRKGPKPSARQKYLIETLLPHLRLEPQLAADPRTYFDSTVSDVWLEVGLGAGEHLLWQVHHHPDVGIIGAEPYEAGVAKLLSRICSQEPWQGERSEDRAVVARHPALAPLRAAPSPPALDEHGSPSSPVCGGDPAEARAGALPPFNIRIYAGDARDILEALPEASLGRVFVLFPDPWPKKRHHKRRFIRMTTLDALARTMKDGAELRFASDDADYFAWTLERFVAHPDFEWRARCTADWKLRLPGWPPTRYEEKSLHGPARYLRFHRLPR